MGLLDPRTGSAGAGCWKQRLEIYGCFLEEAAVMGVEPLSDVAERLLEPVDELARRCECWGSFAA